MTESDRFICFTLDEIAASQVPAATVEGIAHDERRAGKARRPESAPRPLAGPQRRHERRADRQEPGHHARRGDADARQRRDGEDSEADPDPAGDDDEPGPGAARRELGPPDGEADRPAGGGCDRAPRSDEQRRQPVEGDVGGGEGEGEDEHAEGGPPAARSDVCGAARSRNRRYRDSATRFSHESW